jgi:folate-binding protein YgfZ
MNNLPSEYHIIAEAAGWIDRRAHGRLRFEGNDAASFLHALVTNDIESLGVGSGAYAALLTPQGRMVADLTIRRLADHLLVNVPPGQAARLAERFDQLVFSEDVRVSDVSDALAEFAVVGKQAAAALADVFTLSSIQAGELAALPALGHLRSHDAILSRSDAAGLPAFDVFVPSASFDSYVRRFGESGVSPVSQALVEALRIEAGRPAYGVDMTEETIPLEAGLQDRAISMTKGCYVGQEVIVRILHRGGGRVAKRLVRLAIHGVADVPATGTPLLYENHDVGRITSASPSPHADDVIALGYVHRDQAEVGRKVEFDSPTGRHQAELVGIAG